MRTTAFLAVTALLLAGCSGGANQADDNAPLEVWTRSSPEPAATYQEIFAAFTAKTGIQVNYQPVVEFDQQLQARASSKDLPDVLINDAASLGSYQSQGLLLPIEKSSIEGSDSVAPQTWDTAKGVDGQLYGVPFSRQAHVTYLRKDWREKLGLPVPKNWDDLSALANAFATRDPDGNGQNDTYGMNVYGSVERGYMARWAASYLYQAGADIITEASGGKYTVAIDSPQARQAVDWIRTQFCTAGNVAPGALTLTTSTAQFFAEGKAGIYLDGPHYFANYDNKMGKDKYEAIPVPAGPAGTTVLAEGENIYFGASSKKAAQQQKLAAFLISPEAQRIGMLNKVSQVVRIPVNTTLDAAKERGDERWRIPQESFAKSSKMFPAAINFVPVKQALAEGLNKILSDCSGDVSAGLRDTAEAITAELSAQDALKS